MLSIANNIDQIIADNRLLEQLHARVTEHSNYDVELATKIKNYINAYLQNRNEEAPTPKAIYFRFIKAYNKDMKAFAKDGLYPLEIDANRAALGRDEYDIVLLLSCLLAAHRFRIMQLITTTCEKVENGLFIGCGPGLEIELVKSKIENLYAYDLSINESLLLKHPKVHFKEMYFTGENDPVKYDSIYLIELLEHLEEPYTLLEQCKKVLSEKGKIYLTTATNIPQFDHLYKFEAAHEDFESRIKSLGLKTELMEDIPHQSMTLDIGAKNRFYILSL